MSALLNELRARGCDIDGALVRFLNKEDFYARLFKKFVDDASIEGLGDALKAQDVDTAFRHAHTLKGLTANMGLTPLYDIIVQIVEPLRAGRLDDSLTPLYNEFIAEVKNYKILAERDG
ncbi:MAG: Hpt domain-containing protein [Selenomonadaceae bacterium]